MSTELRAAIITLLENGGQVNMDADLACYSTRDGYYFVEYFLNPDTVDTMNLTAHEKKLLDNEEELMEIFDKPEEAADFYMRLTNGRMIPVPSYCRDKSPKKSIKEKVVEVKVAEKDDYF
jgi:hypothetical protein